MRVTDKREQQRQVQSMNKGSYREERGDWTIPAYSVLDLT